MTADQFFLLWMAIVGAVAAVDIALAAERLVQWWLHVLADDPNLRASRSIRATSVARPAPQRPNVTLGAGSYLQAGDSCLDRDPAVTTTSDGSQPAPASPQPAGAGPRLRTAALSPVPDRGEVAPPDDGGGPVYSPVGGGDPRLQPPTGLNLASGEGLEGDGQHGPSSVLAVQATP